MAERKHSKRSKSSRKRSRSRSVSNDSDRLNDDMQRKRELRKEKKKATKFLASFGYTNETNPFGDSSLSEPFIWTKKYENAKDAKSKKAVKHLSERVEEIKKVRKHRQRREVEREDIERLRNEEIRIRDAEQYQDWKEKEEEFHLQQTKVRSKLRIQQRREQPIDRLAKNMLLLCKNREKKEWDGNFHIEYQEPHKVLETLSIEELQELEASIQTYKELEMKEREAIVSKVDGDWVDKKIEYWTLTTILCEDYKRRVQIAARKMEASVYAHGAIHESVYASIVDMLDGKSQEELEELSTQVKQTIESAESSALGIDVEYWEEVAHQVIIFKARARLIAIHREMVDELTIMLSEPRQNRSVKNNEEKEIEEIPHVKHLTDNSQKALAWLENEQNKDPEDEEETMPPTEEVELLDTPNWSEKYRPRKPRYFNRVTTGYDWNKYNQTHYDHETPPPKIVQGYKFNLFYPDLIDPTKTPRYFLEPTNEPEFCILRFSAGPPYHDIAFKIVNREWERSYKWGFKSVFERGILHLYFSFKRHRYRR